MRHHGKGISGKLLSDAVEGFKAEKKAEGRSRLYLDDLRYRLDEFAKGVQRRGSAAHADKRAGLHERAAIRRALFQQSPAHVADVLQLLSGARMALEGNGFAGSCWKTEGAGGGHRGFHARGSAEDSPRGNAEGGNLHRLAGVRRNSFELLRLTWAEVERRKGFIEISAGKAKTAQRRLIPLSDNLAAWLADAPRNGESVWPHSKPFLFEAMRDATAKAGVPWKGNGLRHSFISCRLAERKDVAAVALEAGNSPTMIFRHYRELATEAEAAEWFGVRPTYGAAHKVVRMAS